MIKRKTLSIFKINKYNILFLIGIALISLVHLYKLNIVLTRHTNDGDNLYSENSVIGDGSLLYINDNKIIIFSEADNTIQFYNSDGNFLYSLSLNSYTTVDVVYVSDTKEFYGYYHRGEEWFTISGNNIIKISDEPTFTGEIIKSKCYEFESETYCLEKNILGKATLNALNKEFVTLDNNRIYNQLSLGIIIVFLPVSLFVFAKKFIKWCIKTI